MTLLRRDPRVRAVTRPTDPHGMGLDLVHLDPGATWCPETSLETAALLLSGEVDVDLEGERVRCARGSLFDQEPTVLHVAAGQPATVTALAASELAVFSTANDRPFSPRLFLPGQLLESDLRGKGVLHDAAFRIVRTVFDLRNRPESNLVLGEVVTLPGRWSSYPPHHHPQPEMYHYRFTDPAGYGHAEAGETVYKVRHGDTLLIEGGLDHPQVAAPGYGMYYIWVVRHLPQEPYRGFTYTPEHLPLTHPGFVPWSPTP